MAPAPQTVIEDEEEFLNDVAALHERRGTLFDREPRIGGRSIPLQKLYKLVVERGGYDALSAERMQWRTLVKPFGFPTQHEGTTTFQLKTLYYKNLAAYEIASYWREEPPPREILEDLTAKGGDLRSRTLENHPISSARELAVTTDGQESADEEPATPKEDKTEAEEPGSGGRYPTRQLRQDPKRTQVYQPEPLSSRSRQLRNTNSPQASPGPGQIFNHVSSDPRNPAFNLEKYEPRQPVALTLRPVITPGNAPEIFYQRKALALAQSMPRIVPEPQQFLRGSVANNMTGPSIYLRCLYGLRSGIKEEQDFALHHLVKVSYERGDKYKFDVFPLLSESLLEKALEVSDLVYGVKWQVSYDEEEGTAPPNTLNAAFGTPQLLERLQQLHIYAEDADFDSTQGAQHLERLNEAALVIRNMVILEENAKFLSRVALFRDFLVIAIDLPSQPQLMEFKHYALEMAEQVTRYWQMEPKDPVYLSMLRSVESDDRGIVLSALRAINRIGIETVQTHPLTDVPLSTIERLTAFLTLDSDDELLEATLDFLYEFTATPDNVTSILSSNAGLFPSIMPRLVTVLLHNAVSTEEKILNRPTPQKVQSTPAIPTIPTELYAHLLHYSEPERSSKWLRCCFEESAQDDITQIAIWQAYSGKFAHNGPIPAADFIKNVSNTFSTAQAQVINGPVPRFIIKGIRPRRVLVDTKGNPFFKCFWETGRIDPYDSSGRSGQRQLCTGWQSSRQYLWNHIMIDHLGLQRRPEGRFTNDSTGNYVCKWTGCLRSSPFTSAQDIAIHLRSHIPESAELMSKQINEMAEGGKDREPEFTRHVFYYTAIDERMHPCGIPFMSVLIIRNLARYANKFRQDNRKTESRLMDRLFGPCMNDIWYVVSVNRTLREWLSDLIHMIEKGEREERRGAKREHEDEGGDMIAA